MSLYYVQKYLYELNRTPPMQEIHLSDPVASVTNFAGDGPQILTAAEFNALSNNDIGLLYHLGVNGQILMHFAALHGIEWADYLAQMRAGIEEHGPVREGVYAMTTTLDQRPGGKDT